MQETLEPSLNLQLEDVYCHHVKIGGSRRRKLIARHLSVRSRKPITVQLFLSEAVSQGQWMHSISSPPSNIWFNRERRGPQTELWESTAAMWSGCKHRHEVEERDYKQVWSPRGCPDRLTGEGEGGGMIWAPFIRSSPVNHLSLAGSVVIHVVRMQARVRHWQKHCKEARDRQTADGSTWRLKSWETAETHQFVNSTISNRVITFPPTLPQSPSVSLSLIVHHFVAEKVEDVSIQNGQRRPQTTLVAKQIEFPSVVPFLNESRGCFNSTET